MPQIYEGAAVTLSAASASACSPGFLEDRAQVRDVLDDSFPLPCALKETGQTSVEDILESLGQDDVDMIFLCPSRSCRFSVQDFAKKSIDQRAWTLQESWLAPRLLIYGSAPLQWQCLSAVKLLGGTLPSQKHEYFFPTENRHKFAVPGPVFANLEILASKWRAIGPSILVER